MSETGGDISTDLDNDKAEDNDKKVNEHEERHDGVIVTQPGDSRAVVENHLTATMEADIEKTTSENCLEILSLICVVFWFPFSIPLVCEVVGDDEKAVIYRRGRQSHGIVKGPGCIYVNQCLNTVTKVKMRPVSFDLNFKSITTDQHTVGVIAVIHLRVIDPLLAIHKFKNPKDTLQKLETEILSKSLQDFSIEDILSKPQEVNSKLSNVLEYATQTWGVKIERLEIKSIRQELMVSEEMHDLEGDSKKIVKKGKRPSVDISEAIDNIETTVDVIQTCIDCLGGCADDDS